MGVLHTVISSAHDLASWLHHHLPVSDFLPAAAVTDIFSSTAHRFQSAIPLPDATASSTVGTECTEGCRVSRCDSCVMPKTNHDMIFVGLRSIEFETATHLSFLRIYFLSRMLL